MTTIITTEQVIKTNGVYDLTITRVDNNVTAVKADVTIQIRTEDSNGGFILSASKGVIEKDELGNISIGGKIPADILPNIVSEFNEIITELYSNNVYEVNSAY